MLFLYYSIDVTGPTPDKYAMIRLGGILVKDGVEIETFTLNFAPFPGDFPHMETVNALGLSLEQIKMFAPAKEGVDRLIELIDTHGEGEKCTLVGFGCASKDDLFLRRTFNKVADDFHFTGRFYWPSVDLACICSVLLLPKRDQFDNFGLGTVCEALQIAVDPSRLQQPIYRASLIRVLMRKIKVLER